MKKIFAVFLIITALSVSAHEFWIQPDKFIYKRGETINLKFLAGENFTGQNWSGTREKVQTMRFYFGEVFDSSLGDKLSDVSKGDSLQVALLDEGTAMVTLNTTNSFIELEAAKFNNYLREDGLDDALKYRTENNDTLKAGREYYQRSVKTIFQVGNVKTNACKKRTQLPLDIVPDDNPYSVDKDGDFKVKIYFLDEPLKNTKIKVWHRAFGNLSQQDYTTDEDGKVKFFFSPEGEWMVSCVKMVKVENDGKADWQSYWGSLTLGYTK